MEISDASQYCKIVQADDYIFPQCLELMVQAFEQSKSIGLVSSYWLHGDVGKYRAGLQACATVHEYALSSRAATAEIQEEVQAGVLSRPREGGTPTS
jgi:hypothetical protein